VTAVLETRVFHAVVHQSTNELEKRESERERVRVRRVRRVR
jgi:hypothetical protein